ncbi:winged helix-turn-helix transcriptional regulator [Actinoallomurus rhizosphaericola]|uniref:winged helix-turn-helix transcriptional regulator n=1 Tax=Actinoallomurus rhizosphaericola TaxID=2952536 RepID=UPI002093E62E|nr:helix-turn-helix domain-containing protein [Actinoallomurus rhizosphaericola]MCO6000089.1 helix-turn-helix transcriptional regulator [Actinoallomurus rhizosphaericola]
MTTRIDPRDLPGRPCSLAAALKIVGDRWALPAIREVMLGNHRFRQIAKNTGAPTDRLAARLKALVENGVLERRPLPDDGQRQGYYLTRAGRELADVTSALMSWGDRWAVTSPPVRMRHKDHDLVVHTVCGVCGDTVRNTDVQREDITPGWTAAGFEEPARS